MLLRSLTRLMTLAALVLLVYATHLVISRRYSEVNETETVVAGHHGLEAHSQSADDSEVPKANNRGQAGSQAQSRFQLTDGPLTDHPLRTTNQEVNFPAVKLNQRGEFLYDPTEHTSVHPIKLLIERGRKQAAKIEARIKRRHTLQDAVKDYTSAWGMKPPKGFDVWYDFVNSTNSVWLPSMFPMAHKPFLQYLSLSAQTLRERIDIQENKEMMYTISFVPNGRGDEGTQCDENGDWDPEDWHTRGRGRVKIAGTAAWSWRCNNTLTLMLPILPKLPEEFFNMDPPLKIVFNVDDGPRGQVHYDFQKRSEAYGRAGKVWSPAQLNTAEQNMRWTFGWQWTCPPDSPLKQSSLSQVLNENKDVSMEVSRPKSFVGDFYMQLDVCYNPELRHLNSFAIKDERLAAVNLVPYISVARSLRHSDITMVPLDAVYQTVGLIKWKSKTKAKIFWRGSPTGISHTKGIPWRQSQRHRLNFFANNQSEAPHKILIERNNAVHSEPYRLKEMNERWFDIGLSGGPAQCNEEDGSCKELAETVPWKDVVRGPETLLYKYAVDVDGNAWSSRFRRLLASNNVVLKSTAWPEWFSDLLVPWYHYVPVHHDYDDIYDVMAFFEGAPDGSTTGHSDLAEEIAMNGVNFVKEHWRVPDMQSFVLLIFLEYWRLVSDDRAAASYTK